MRKLIFISIVNLFLVYSCASSNSDSSGSGSSNPNKRNMGAQKELIGTWNLDDVSYSESLVKVKAFDLYDAQCLKNSTWFFVSNNNTGNFTLTSGGECPSSTQKFTWYIDQQNMFILKLLGEGDKAKKVTTGTTYLFQSISENEFTLTQQVNEVKIAYHFTKLSSKKLN